MEVEDVDPKFAVVQNDTYEPSIRLFATLDAARKVFEDPSSTYGDGRKMLMLILKTQ